MEDELLKKSTTTDGKPPREGHEHGGAPAPINPRSGQHDAYWILTETERAKGFVRPVRRSYQHVGARPKYPLRDLKMPEEKHFADSGYVKYEEYPPDLKKGPGRLWTADQLKSGCGTITTMAQAIAETYARQPGYYTSTFCTSCRTHLPVGEHGEFNWVDEQGNVTEEKVGT